MIILLVKESLRREASVLGPMTGWSVLSKIKVRKS
jgi:hypothetical protein